VDTAEVK